MIVTVHQTPSEICWWENSNLVEHTYRPDFSLTKKKKQVQRQPLCIYVEKDSFSMRIISPNTPQSDARTTLRSKKTKE